MWLVFFCHPPLVVFGSLWEKLVVFLKDDLDLYQLVIASLILQGALLKRSPPSELHCAAWETALEYQWMLSIFILKLSLILLLLSLPPHPPSFVLYCSYFLFCVCRCVCVCLCHCLSGGLSTVAGLSCAVICHTVEEKKHLLLMLPPFSLFLHLSVSVHLFFALFATVVPAILNPCSVIFS